MRTDELIVELARSAGPVRRLAKPSIRFARWTAASVPLIVLGVIVIGPREDVVTAVSQPSFLAIAAATIATSLLAAASALVLAIPGAERSSLQRMAPLIAGSAWAIGLAYLLASEGAAARRLLAWPFHWLCLIEIVAFALIPGLALLAMLRRAAPLQRAWSGALAALAAIASGAAATQFLCPLDDSAHQLIGHVLPVAGLSMLGALAGPRFLNWANH